jgi:hypothetical protein
MTQRLRQFIRFAEEPVRAEPGVYIVRRWRDQACKIGCSADVPSRVAVIIAQQSGKADLVHTIAAPEFREAEAYFHRIYRAAALGREWFDLNEADLERLRAFKTWPKEG